jgi:hypothetical protein
MLTLIWASALGAVAAKPMLARAAAARARLLNRVMKFSLIVESRSRSVAAGRVVRRAGEIVDPQV